MKKKPPRRIPIPAPVAAKVLFLSDRICCVCRAPGKAVQIHHLDDDPGNNDENNLSVLCFECHQKTQVRGGFDRKLDADQIVLYRSEWHRFVAVARARHAPERSPDPAPAGTTAALRATALAEIYRDRSEYELLAIHYDSIGNEELRDKYIEIAIRDTPTDETVFFLRRLQNRMDRVPRGVSQRVLAQFKKIGDRTQIARYYRDIGDDVSAVREYARVVLSALADDNPFSAAFYLKEVGQLIPNLFLAAFAQAKERGELWWQVRSLQELGWHTQLRELLLENQKRIDRSDDIELKRLLAEALGDHEKALRLEQEGARTESLKGFEGAIGPDAGDRHDDGSPVKR